MRMVQAECTTKKDLYDLAAVVAEGGDGCLARPG